MSKFTISFDDFDFVPSPLRIPVYPYPKPPEGNLPPRDRRLYSDAEKVATRLAKSLYIGLVEMRGTPPDYYRLVYNIRGIEAVRGNHVVYRNKHEVELQLTREYPNQPPLCKMLTPIFHPNISPARICIGNSGDWTAQEKLVDVIFRIGEIITYQSCNPSDPLPDSREVALWANEHKYMFPFDKAELIPPE